MYIYIYIYMCVCVCVCVCVCARACVLILVQRACLLSAGSQYHILSMNLAEVMAGRSPSHKVSDIR